MRYSVLGLVITVWLLAPLQAASAETPTCAGRPATIVGTGGDDEIRGTPGDDVIVALGGDDVVDPRGGDDVVCGGSGRDHLRSDRGRDVLIGGPGGDRLEALSRRPAVLRGGAGADRLRLGITDEPGYVIDGGAGRDLGELGLQLRAHDGGPALEIRRATGDLLRAGARTGGFRSIERLRLDELLAYEYYGTDARDIVSVSDGAFPFRAFTYGGADRVRSSEGDDYIDAGLGQDRVDAGPGFDICISAERARGCENVTRSSVSP